MEGDTDITHPTLLTWLWTYQSTGLKGKLVKFDVPRDCPDLLQIVTEHGSARIGVFLSHFISLSVYSSLQRCRRKISWAFSIFLQ